MTAIALQTPQIIDVKAAKIFVRHPDIKRNLTTRLRDVLNATTAAATVSDNNGFADTDKVLIGYPGNSKAEVETVTGAPTRGQTLTLSGSNVFSHSEEPIIRVYETTIKFYGADDASGTGKALMDTITITWDKPYTEYAIPHGDAEYAYYGVEFSDGTTESTVSTYVPATGQPFNSASVIIHKALAKCNEVVQPEAPNNRLTYSYLLDGLQEGVEEILSFVLTDRAGRTYKVEWPFEFVGQEDSDNWLSCSEMEDKYALSGLTDTIKYSDVPQSILNVRLGNEGVLKKMDIRDYDDLLQGMKRTEVGTEFVIGATSAVVEDASYLSDSGSIRVGDDTITYTGKTGNTLTGIPASGDGSITDTWAVGRAIWQGVSGGQPQRYAVYDGNLYLDQPVSSTYADYQLKLRYSAFTNRITTLSATVIIPQDFVRALYYYTRYIIKMAKGDEDVKDYQQFIKIVTGAAHTLKSPVMDTESYYTFTDAEPANDPSPSFGYNQD